MSIIELLKEVNPKKNGWFTIIAIVGFAIFEIISNNFLPKDPTCTQNQKYYQGLVSRILRHDEIKDSLRDIQDFKKDSELNLYRNGYTPFKPVLKKVNR